MLSAPSTPLDRRPEPLRRLGGRLRPQLPLLGLVALSFALAGGAMVLMHVLGIVAWDSPAHLYKIALVKRFRTFLWDNNWYGGVYQLISYGFVFYWLAQYIDYQLLVLVAAGTMPLFFYLYMRRVYGSTGFWPAISLAITLALYLVNGQDPFLLAMSLTMLGLVLLAYGRPFLGAAFTAVAIFTNPLAFVTGAVFLLAEFIAFPERRRAMIRFGVYLLPFIAARLTIGFVFPEESTYIYPYSEVIHFAGFGVMGFLFARMSLDPARRAKQIFFLSYAAVACLLAFFHNNPVGSNIGRIFFVFGLTLLLDIRKIYAPRWLVVTFIVGFASGQVIPPAAHYFQMAGSRSTQASYFAPALSFAAIHRDPDYRVHIVALKTHWEAYFFPMKGFAITRGWYRQDDALHNAILEGDFTETQYVDWLRSMGVEFVYLPHDKLDWSGAAETAVLTTSSSFSQVFADADWTIYRLRRPQPLAVSLDGGADATVTGIDRDSIRLTVPAPGHYLVKVSFSPFWKIFQGAATLSRSVDDFLILDAPAAGAYGMRVSVDLREGLQDLSW